MEAIGSKELEAEVRGRKVRSGYIPADFDDYADDVLDIEYSCEPQNSRNQTSVATEDRRALNSRTVRSRPF